VKYRGKDWRRRPAIRTAKLNPDDPAEFARELQDRLEKATGQKPVLVDDRTIGRDR